MSQPRIFISYARASDPCRARITELEAALEGAHFQILRDERMKGGTPWREQLDRWMWTCHGAVVFLSPEALESAWVRTEVEHFARRRRAYDGDHVVVPVLGEGSPSDKPRAGPPASCPSDPLLPQVQRTVCLRELAAAVATRLHTAVPDGTHEEALAERARRAGSRGAWLGELGRREEALAATREAVDTFRKLAEKRPDAVLPSLAMSLSVHGDSLTALDRHTGAHDAYLESITTLAPSFTQHPTAHAALMRATMRGYLTASTSADLPPDQALLTPIQHTLDALSGNT